MTICLKLLEETVWAILKLKGTLTCMTNVSLLTNILLLTIFIPPDSMGTQSYDLIVSVNDTEQLDFLQINVLVQDVNDNDPIFANETYKQVAIAPHFHYALILTLVTCSFAVRENEAVGTIIGEVYAEDVDTGTFGEIVYSISGFGSQKCVI